MTKRLLIGGLAALALLAHTPQGAAAATGCQVAAPTTAAGYEKAFASLSPAQWWASDGFTTVSLPSGRVLWMSGDTAANGTMWHSSFVVQDRGCFHGLMHQAVPDQPDGSEYWPQQGLVEQGELQVLASHLLVTPGQPWPGWQDLGTSVVTYSLTSGDPVWVSTVDQPRPGGVSWGAGLDRTSTWTYVFGTKTGAWFGLGVYVARYPNTASMGTQRAWRYWNGSTWVKDPTKATEVITSGPGGTESQVTVWHAKGVWSLVTKANGAWGDTLVRMDAPKPTGPWSSKVLATGLGWTETSQVYNSQAHPQARLTSGKVLVSIARQAIDGATIWTDPARFRPMFLEVG